MRILDLLINGTKRKNEHEEINLSSMVNPVNVQWSRLWRIKRLVGVRQGRNEKAPRYTSIAFQAKNSTATRKRTGYRVMNKTDTHSDIILGI